MPTAQSDTGGLLHTITTTVFLLLAFLAPGAWLIVNIPTAEKAQLCFLLATLACAALACAKLLPMRRPAKGAVLAAGLVTAAFLLALVTNAFPVQQFLYDLYGEMPGYLWLCYPVVFLLAASLGLGRWVRTALRVVTVVGLVLLAVALYQRFYTPWVNVFGSSAYNVSAFIPIPVLALWLATMDLRGMRRAGSATLATRVPVILWFAAALAAAVAVVAISYGLLGIFAVVGLVVLIAALRPQLLGLPEGRFCKGVQVGGRIALALFVLALVAALFPPVSGLAVKRSDLQNLSSENIRSRLEFSYASEGLVAARPLTGAGPAGFRFNVYRYLNPWIYGNTGTIGTEPLAYSPPSPHSLPWEITTRLGVIGLIALLGAGWFWLRDTAGGAGLTLGRKGKRDAAASGDKPSGSIVDLRAACMIAALAWLLSLFVTPMHFASGLLGAALAGLACARPQATGMDALVLPSAAKVAGRVAGCVALVVVAIFFSRQQSALARVPGIVTGGADAQGLSLLESVDQTVPGDPTVENYLIQMRLLLAANPQELNQQIKAAQAAPGYITEYTPNFTQFAQYALSQMQSLQTSDTANFSAVTDLLHKAASTGPVTPALLGEQLHLAVASGSEAAIARATAEVKQPRFNGETAADLYPPIADYLAAAKASKQ